MSRELRQPLTADCPVLNKVKRGFSGSDFTPQGLCRFYDFESNNLIKMTLVECGKSIIPFQCGRSHHEVIIADHFSGRCQHSPDPGMFIRGLLCIGKDWQRGHNGLQVLTSPGFVNATRPLHSMPQLGYGDGGNCKMLVRSNCQPFRQIEYALLAPNNDVSIEDYCHLSGGDFSNFRAVLRSLDQALATAGDSAALVKASANSLPVQILSLAGQRRAKGSPFFSRIKWTF